MKNLIAVILIFFIRIVFAENTIIALVNNTPISLNSIQNKYKNLNPNEEKIEIINAQIDLVLQLEKVDEFNLYPTSEDIHTVLIDVANNNNISIEQLLNFDEIVPELVKENVGHDWWTVDLCFWPEAWTATEKCKKALDGLISKYG